MKYTIKKGKHFADWWWIRWLWSLHYGDTIKATVIFHESCAYKHPQPQWDKTFGWGSFWNPDKHSARFAHQYMEHDFGGWFDITHYKHEFFKHDGAEADNHKTDTMVKEVPRVLEIRKTKMKNGKTHLAYKIDGGFLHTEKTEIPYSKWGWKLYPYIGGNYPAKQDTHITITQAA